MSYKTLEYWKHERKYCIKFLYIVGKGTYDIHDRIVKETWKNMKEIQT
jgi:hypothetical protein